MTAYNHNRFAYEQDPAVWVSGDVIGKRYNSQSIILDVAMVSDDDVLVLVVEDDEDNEDDPFVIFELNLDALDVRQHEHHESTLRYAVIEWEFRCSQDR